jgi:hypothetical protein
MGKWGRVRKFLGRFMKTFLSRFYDFIYAQVAVSLLMAFAILGTQVHLGLIERGAIRANVLALSEPYLYFLVALAVWHLLHTSFVLYWENQDEITALNVALISVENKAGLLIKNNVSSADWRDLANKFAKVSQFPLRVQYQSTQGEVSWDLRDPKYQALCMLAGSMLLKSRRVQTSLPTSVSTDPDPISRWLNYLKELKRTTDKMYLTEDQVNGTKLIHYLGTISDVGQASENLCIECSAREV